MAKKRMLEIVEAGLNNDETFNIPSLGTAFTFLNTGRAKKSIITKCGAQIISLKVSDVRFTATLNPCEKMEFTYNFLDVTDWRDNPIKSDSDLVFSYRFKGKNFFLRPNADPTKLYRQMKDYMLKQFDKAVQYLRKDVAETIKKNIIIRINSGTAFKIADLITMDKETGAVCWWKNTQAEGTCKMVLVGFKNSLSSKEYIPVSHENIEEATEMSGGLNIDKCVAVTSGEFKNICAHRARALDKQIVVNL